MKNYTTPRTMADTQFYTSYPSVRKERLGVWYGVYLVVCATATVAVILLSING